MKKMLQEYYMIYNHLVDPWKILIKINNIKRKNIKIQKTHIYFIIIVNINSKRQDKGFIINVKSKKKKN